jgi:hypothetical protein
LLAAQAQLRALEAVAVVCFLPDRMEVFTTVNRTAALEEMAVAAAVAAGMLVPLAVAEMVLR